MKPKSYLFKALGKYKFSERYLRFIFDIGLRKQSFLLAPRRLGRFFLLINVPSREERLRLFSQAMVSII